MRLVIPGIAVSPGVTHSDSRIVLCHGYCRKTPTTNQPLSVREIPLKRLLKLDSPFLVQQMGIPTFERKNHGYNIRTNKQEHTKEFVIDGSTLKWEKQVKFLGMIFDENLTWKAHIDYVVGRCKQRLNLMRCVSGNSWGANKTSLLHIYRATIRSIIDYGSAAYNSALPYVKSKLTRPDSSSSTTNRLWSHAMHFHILNPSRMRRNATSTTKRGNSSEIRSQNRSRR